jgi:cation diffusion facilitator CzcD-associated flavoprotein CzcO
MNDQDDDHQAAQHDSRPALRFAIIGAGMSGVLSAIKLEKAGYHDYVIYEKADRLGGTWRENTYPGIACDVPSHLYSYSFEPNAEWSHRYSPGSEIQAYFEGVAHRHGIDQRIVFGAEIDRAEFIDGRWVLITRAGDRDTFDIVIAATGVLHHPNVPDIAGLSSFAGASFHSARWDHRVALDGKRVGVVGTGSTAVQIVTALVDRAKSITMFQRTPQWISPQENPAYSSLEQQQFRTHPEIITQMREEISRGFAERFSNVVINADSPEMQVIEAICRANLEDNVHDPVLREKLRPNYRAACKRMVISQDFYQAIQKPNAELITEPIDGVEAAGVRTTDGALHELDVLVLATGFRADQFMRPMHVIGRNGVKLDELWAQRPSAYLSISIPSFPNLFMLNGPNGPVGNFSLIEVAELQFDYILALIEEISAGRCREISASHSATTTFDEARTEAAKKTVWASGCRSWYLDDRGIPATWPWTFDHFREEMAAPRLADFELI